ncbi:MAG: hypothetical protein ACYSTS_08620 [Planctomycetota bacterium]|jgi:hypothetical protein
MITNPGWNKPEERAYFHQLSQDCIAKLAEVFTTVRMGKIDIDTAFRMYAKILKDEISDQEFLSFAMENLNKLSSYIAKGIPTIRIHRNDVDEIWFDVDEV